jgi:hypothetical protein
VRAGAEPGHIDAGLGDGVLGGAASPAGHGFFLGQLARTLSAMCPWTPQHRGPQRYKVTHSGTRRKRPAGPRFRSPGAVFAGGGRCWVRTNVG